jgi:gliding motility-associated-like protein
MRVFLLLILILMFAGSFAQCPAVINTFPHVQDFETSDGNWAAGGTASDWSYGTPAKPIISGAASGTKAWMAGGLSGSAYANGENSWLISTCYDLSSLTAPMVRFKVFWETERRWDGASMDYSTDGGNTWTRAGSVNDSTDCTTSNWFNFPSINNVGEGWSGTVKQTSGSCIGGGGIGQWVTAQHQFLNLAGKPSVRFRFTFTAGTTCNNFDGFAIDDFSVLNTPPPSADFNFTCSGNQTVAFNSIYNCPVAYEWNFGDPGSATYNIAYNKNPTHTFSAAGSYPVTLKVTDQSGQVIQSTTNVTVLGATAIVTSPISCHDVSDGALNASGAGLPAGGVYAFEWNTSPPKQTSAITNRPAGNYTVTVSSANTCAATATVTLINPGILLHTVSINHETCNQKNGTATIHQSGGTAPYRFTWNPTGSNTDSSSGLIAGNYTVYIIDAHQCTDTAKFAVLNINNIQLHIDTVVNISCTGRKDGRISVSGSGGVNGFTYTWTPAVARGSNAYNLPPGNYNVVVTDGGGCSASATIPIVEPPVFTISLGDDLVICKDANLPISPGAYAKYSWQDSSNASSFFINKAGKYWVRVESANGCIAADTINVIEDCHDIVFPSAFTPNGDRKNDVFRPLGTLTAMSDYRFSIFNRWGQLVYQTTNSHDGWNGKFNGVNAPAATYIWVAEFSFNHQPRRLLKGSIVLIR